MTMPPENVKVAESVSTPKPFPPTPFSVQHGNYREFSLRSRCKVVRIVAAAIGLGRWYDLIPISIGQSESIASTRKP